MPKPKRDYAIGQHLDERPIEEAPVRKVSDCQMFFFSSQKQQKSYLLNGSEIIDIEERKVKSKTAKAGYSLRKASLLSGTILRVSTRSS